MLTLSEIRDEVERLAALVGAPAHLLPTYGRTEDGARPHVEVDSRGYHYVVVERGNELTRVTTDDLDELLFNIFEAVTFSLATRHELTHRVEGQDFRRLLFGRQVGLLSALSPRWGEREALSHDAVLRRHPFKDQR
ncbi:MAG TPA: Imm63 family immunity protein [Pyrinomonadaceae bacterium]|nr:Imm63 family immunity protein [Pyrinomonadaceae bacterium]